MSAKKAIEPVGCADVDYKAYYNNAIKDNKELFEENAVLRETIIGMCISLFGKGGVPNEIL